MRRSSGSSPSSLASSRIEERVTPSRIEPVSSGVTRRLSRVTKKRFIPPSSSMYVCVEESRKTAWSQPCSMPSSWPARRRRVVAAGLRGAGAAGAGAGVVLGDPQRHRLQAAGEVGAGRRGDEAVGDLVRRAHAEEGLGGEHERPQVQARLAGAGRRHPRLVDLERGRAATRRSRRSAARAAPGGGRCAASARRWPRGGTTRPSRRRGGRPSGPRRSPGRSAAPRRSASAGSGRRARPGRRPSRRSWSTPHAPCGR